MLQSRRRGQNELVLTSIGVVQPEKKWNHGWFPRSTRPHHSHDATGRDQEIQILENGGFFTCRVGKRDITELELAFQLVRWEDFTFCGGAEDFIVLNQTKLKTRLEIDFKQKSYI